MKDGEKMFEGILNNGSTRIRDTRAIDAKEKSSCIGRWEWIKDNVLDWLGFGLNDEKRPLQVVRFLLWEVDEKFWLFGLDIMIDLSFWRVMESNSVF